jgi:hypothetical protein
MTVSAGGRNGERSRCRTAERRRAGTARRGRGRSGRGWSVPSGCAAGVEEQNAVRGERAMAAMGDRCAVLLGTALMAGFTGEWERCRVGGRGGLGLRAHHRGQRDHGDGECSGRATGLEQRRTSHRDYLQLDCCGFSFVEAAFRESGPTARAVRAGAIGTPSVRAGVGQSHACLRVMRTGQFSSTGRPRRFARAKKMSCCRRFSSSSARTRTSCSSGTRGDGYGRPRRNRRQRCTRRKSFRKSGAADGALVAHTRIRGRGSRRRAARDRTTRGHATRHRGRGAVSQPRRVDRVRQRVRGETSPPDRREANGRGRTSRRRRHAANGRGRTSHRRRHAANGRCRTSRRRRPAAIGRGALSLRRGDRVRRRGHGATSHRVRLAAIDPGARRNPIRPIVDSRVRS